MSSLAAVVTNPPTLHQNEEQGVVRLFDCLEVRNLAGTENVFFEATEQFGVLPAPRMAECPENRIYTDFFFRFENQSRRWTNERMLRPDQVLHRGIAGFEVVSLV